MANALQKKHGPLETWQWIALAAGSLLIFYLYRRNASSSSSTTVAPTPADASANPATTGGATSAIPSPSTGVVDPTTGQDLSSLGDLSANGTGGTGTGPSLDQELTDFQSIETLLSGLQSIAPTPTADGSSTDVTTTLAQPLGQIESTLTGINKTLKGLKVGPAPKKKTATHPKNPGHTVTTHSNGKKSASSTVHNAGQRSPQKTVAKPAHQKAPSRHPSKPKGHH